jgi:hypothetical protein
MTIYVNETNLVVEVAFNLANLELGNGYLFTITSQYSHQPLILTPDCIESNARYTKFSMAFPTGFGEEHKNGVYYWDLTYLDQSIQKGLLKLITEPGGSMNTLAYNPGVITEERVAEVFYRPNY